MNPVSYTHLDVYKRQVITSIYHIKHCPLRNIFNVFSINVFYLRSSYFNRRIYWNNMKSLIDDSKFIATKIKYSINLFYYCLNDIIIDLFKMCIRDRDRTLRGVGKGLPEHKEDGR